MAEVAESAEVVVVVLVVERVERVRMEAPVTLVVKRGWLTVPSRLLQLHQRQSSSRNRDQVWVVVAAAVVMVVVRRGWTWKRVRRTRPMHL